MLVFTRREGEEIVIGDPKNPLGIVRVASIRGDRVRIAFDFPREVPVNRREIADQIIGDEAIAPPAERAQANGTSGIIGTGNHPASPSQNTPPPPHVSPQQKPPHTPVIIKRDVIGSIKPKPPLST